MYMFMSLWRVHKRSEKGYHATMSQSGRVSLNEEGSRLVVTLEGEEPKGRRAAHDDAARMHLRGEGEDVRVRELSANRDVVSHVGGKLGSQSGCCGRVRPEGRRGILFEV